LHERRKRNVNATDLRLEIVLDFGQPSPEMKRVVR
jgi:hypothetical protein